MSVLVIMLLQLIILVINNGLLHTGLIFVVEHDHKNNFQHGN